MNLDQRLKNLERDLDARRLDALLLTHLPNLHYLCGFTGSSGILAFVAGEWFFFTDGRYTEQARAQVRGAAVRVSGAAPLTQALELVARRLGRSPARARIGFEAEHATVATRDRVVSELERRVRRSSFRLVPTSGLVEQLRITKDEQETAQIRRAVELASGIFPKVVQALDSGRTENDLAAELEYLARRAGAEKMSFETIVAAGARSALPHARPTRAKIGRGFVVLDYGVILGGYCSDMTRTVHAGRPDRRARELYSAVLEAQLAGISAVGPGVRAEQVDAAARKVLRRHKLERYFTHSLGHGVGIEIHEAPRLARGQTQQLEPGMVITIEPGVYIPADGGVRIEDMLLVTPTGHEVLTP